MAGERREEGARKRPTRRHCAVRIPKKMLWTRKIQTVVATESSNPKYQSDIEASRLDEIQATISFKRVHHHRDHAEVEKVLQGSLYGRSSSLAAAIQQQCLE